MVKIPYIYIICVAAITWALLATKGCNDKSGELTQLDSYNKSLKDTALQAFKAKDGVETVYKLQVQVDKNVITEITNENSSLKKKLEDMKVKTWSVQTITQVETRTVLVHDTIKLKKDTIKIGNNESIPFADSNKNYNIQGQVAPSQVIFTQISFKDSATMVSETQGGFLRKEQYELKISHSNPYISTTGLESFILKSEKKWFQTTVFKFGTGVIAGILIKTAIK
jgi:hypothetical protein